MKRNKIKHMGQEITQVIELVDKDIKTIVTVVSHMFKKFEERLNF